VVEHALVGAGTFGDRIDAGAAHAVFGKFLRCRLKDRRLGPFGVALKHALAAGALRLFLVPSLAGIVHRLISPDANVALIRLRCEVVQAKFEEETSRNQDRLTGFVLVHSL